MQTCKWPFKLLEKFVPEFPHPGAFGAYRKYDMHTGVDLYADPGTPVHMIEPGVIVGAGQFTGKDVGSPWWKDTYYILVESKDRVLLYGELDRIRVQELSNYIGWKMGKICLGFVEPVLEKEGHLYYSMLHLEEYDLGYRGSGVVWLLGERKPQKLRDPTKWLKEL